MQKRGENVPFHVQCNSFNVIRGAFEMNRRNWDTGNSSTDLLIFVEGEVVLMEEITVILL